MRMRVSLSGMLLLTGCASPLGPPFGAGPEVDTVFGILVILLFAGLLYRAAKDWLNPKHFEPPPIHIARERYGRPTGSVLQLDECLRPLLPNVVFHRPTLLHTNPSVLAEQCLADLQTKDIPPSSIIVGISLG